MRRAAVAAALLLLTGCSWSNALYQARTRSRDAERAQADGRPGDAADAWAQAAVKAESAYARTRGGEHAAEALWLQGRALARTGRCLEAIPPLEAALGLGGTPPWRERMILELARCTERERGAGAEPYYAQLTGSADTALAHEAHRRLGHFRVAAGDWAGALALLERQDGRDVRIDRALALVALGRTDPALEAVAPLLAAGDTAVAWERLVEGFARRDAADADALLDRLLAMPAATDAHRGRWLLAGAQYAPVADSLAARRRFDRLFALPPSRDVSTGRLLQGEAGIVRADSPDALRRALLALGPIESGGGLAAIRIAEIRRLATRVLGGGDTLAAGAPTGDLVLFALAGEARDSLAAPRLAAWLFGRIEREWAASPYLPKAIYGRLLLVPDSADALRARLAALGDGPYAAFLRGEEHPAFRALEDSLQRFLVARARRLAAPAPVVDQ